MLNALVKKNYRPDIDGLRALSVLSVIFFHAFPNLLPGGFIGVDIFFVISGYLITNIIIKNLNSGSLKIIDFYRHRVLRIFPSLIVVLLFVLISGYLISTQPEYKRIGGNLFGGTAFIINFILLKEVNYFDVAANTKPLLHLWSLSVEEQFYLLWPIILWICYKLRISLIFTTFSIFILSFSFSIFIAQQNIVFDFFSPLTRFWEILSGAALVIIERKHTTITSKKTSSIISILGLALIITGLVSFNGNTPFPSWRAVFPVLGATLIIASGPHALINSKILSLKPMLFVGIISYPLYLWHWPLLAYARILINENLNFSELLFIIGISFILSILTFIFIEKPLRFGSNSNLKVIILCITLIIIGLFGAIIYKNNGLSSRYIAKYNPPTGLAALNRQSPYVKVCSLSKDKPLEAWCYSDTREAPHALLLGDSHAEALYWSLVKNSQPAMRWMLSARFACAPMANMKRITSSKANVPDQQSNDLSECEAQNKAALEYATKSKNIDVVAIYSASRILNSENYSFNFGEKPIQDGAFIGLSNIISDLEHAGKKVIFLEDNPFIGESAQCVLRRSGLSWLDKGIERIQRTDKCSLAYDKYQELSEKYHQQVSELGKKHPNMIIYKTETILCDKSNNKCPMFKNGNALYSYGDHISTYSGDMIAKDLDSFIK